MKGMTAWVNPIHSTPQRLQTALLRDPNCTHKINLRPCNFLYTIIIIIMLKLGRFGKQIRNTWKVLKCGAGEGWRRSVGSFM